MVAGWSVAARLQPRPVDLVAEPVSALAAVGAADRWVMSATFVVVGACVFVTGLALRPAGAPGRLMLMAGAVAGMLVAANPEHPGTSFPVPHMICAAAGCAGVVAWPAGAWRRGRPVPWGLRPAVSAGAVAVLLALVAWFGVELIAGGGLADLAERIFGAALALWPLAVVASCRHAARKLRTRPEPVRPAPGRRSAQTGRACARPAVRLVPSGIVTAGRAPPRDMMTHRCELPTLGFTHLQFETLLTAARQSADPCDFALVAMLGLLSLRIFEATGADIADPGEQHDHRVLRVCGKGTKAVLVPLPPAVARAIDQATGARTGGPILRNSRGARMDRHAATRRLRHLAETAGVRISRPPPPPTALPGGPAVSTPGERPVLPRGRCAGALPSRRLRT